MSVPPVGEWLTLLAVLVVLFGLLLVLFASLFGLIRWRRRGSSTAPAGRARVEHLLILSPAPLRDPHEVGALVARIWPGGLDEGARITTYRAPPDRGLAEAVVFREESEGRLPPGSSTRMSVVHVDPGRLVVAVHAAAPDVPHLPPEREQIARRVAELLLATQRRWHGLTDAQQDAALDRAHLDALIASGEDVEGWLRDPVELRAIGHRLDREGGMQLMVPVAERAAALSAVPGALRMIEMSWDGIGDWSG